MSQNTDDSLEVLNNMKNELTSQEAKDDFDKKTGKIRETVARLQRSKEEFDRKHPGADKESVRLMATAGIAKSGNGLKKMIKGIQASDPISGISGFLEMMTSITEMLTEVGKKWGPRFEIIKDILTIVSTIFSLFGGSTGGQESCEAMIERVINDKLEEAKVEELEADVEGLTRYYGALSNSIQEFRAQKVITDEQIREFYVKSFEGVRFFGRLQFYIEKWCDLGNENDDSKVKKSAKRCLTLCDLYAQLSVIRQTLLFDLACFLKVEVDKENDAKEALDLMLEEQKTDMDIFKFLTDPINYRNYRPVYLHFYSRVGDYSMLFAYIQTLHLTMKRDQNTNYISNSIMLCDDIKLKGECTSINEASDLATLSNWDKKTRSFYISANRQLIAYEGKNYGSFYSGPYYGPSVFGKLYFDKRLRSFKIEENAQNSSNMMRICDKDFLAEDAVCAVIKPKLDIKLASPFKGFGTNNHQGETWAKKVHSLTIPAGLKIALYGFGPPYNRKAFGPYYGPETLNKLSSNELAVLDVIESDSFTSSTVVKICSGTGICCHVEPLSQVGQEKKYNDTSSDLCDIDFGKVENKIASMQIPGGILVELYQEKNFAGRQYGPYTGPRRMNKIDGAKNANDFIGSFKVIRLF